MTTHNHDVLMAVNSRIINGRKALVKAMDEIIKLRKALAEQPAQQEPVAWIRWEWNRSGLRSLTFSKPDEMPLAEEATGVVYDPLYTSPPAQQEPVAYVHNETGLLRLANRAKGSDFEPDDWTSLYTTPPAQRKPLTDEKINELVIRHAGYGQSNFYAVVRAVEAAHGIKENT